MTTTGHQAMAKTLGAISLLGAGLCLTGLARLWLYYLPQAEIAGLKEVLIEPNRLNPFTPGFLMPLLRLFDFDFPLGEYHVVIASPAGREASR